MAPVWAARSGPGPTRPAEERGFEPLELQLSHARRLEAASQTECDDLATMMEIGKPTLQLVRRQGQG
jgi:hypothetical protein